MSITEAQPRPGEIYVPQPGTLEHLDYICRLEFPQNLSFNELQTLLLQHQITESLIKVITKNRTSPPSTETKNFSMDSRFGPGKKQTPIIRGVLYGISREFERPTLAIHGQPWPRDKQGFEYTYDLTIPLTSSQELDLNGSLEAVISRGWIDSPTGRNRKYALLEQVKKRDTLIYRPWTKGHWTKGRYQENDSEVFTFALQECARDISTYIRETYLETDSAAA
jgi:hypothetical protein